MTVMWEYAPYESPRRSSTWRPPSGVGLDHAKEDDIPFMLAFLKPKSGTYPQPRRDDLRGYGVPSLLRAPCRVRHRRFPATNPATSGGLRARADRADTSGFQRDEAQDSREAILSHELESDVCVSPYGRGFGAPPR